MRTALHYVLALATLATSMSTAPAALAQEQMHVPSVVLVQLPQFCWGRYKVPNAVGPEFNMPPAKVCGYFTNHYCDGLILLIQAKHETKKGARLSMLGAADANIRYTEAGIRDYPGCPIRDHVAASKAEVENLLRIYGGKPYSAH